MQTDLWKLPDILVLHIKRFHYESGHLEKLDAAVQFPLYELDVSEWVQTEQKEK